MRTGIPYIVLWIWQLPQHLVALFLRVIIKPVSLEFYNGCRIYWVKQKLVGVSLGQFIFLSTHYQIQTLKHEYGHSVQSLWLGPLYLIIISVPSLVLCYLRDMFFHKKWDMPKRIQWYYRQPTERSADRLGGVDRAMYATE